MYAHRVFPGLLVNEVSINSSRQDTLTLIVENNNGPKSQDILFEKVPEDYLESVHGAVMGKKKVQQYKKIDKK